MRKIYTVLALAAAFIPSALLAQGAPVRFTRAGIAYRYTVTPAAHGRQVIEGRRLSDGARFRLVVDGDKVDGIAGGQPVAFRVPAASAVAMAAR